VQGQYSSNSTVPQFINQHVILGGVMVIMLAIGPNFCRFKPDQGQWIFNGNKNP
jgi:hypothetical protein